MHPVSLRPLIQGLLLVDQRRRIDVLQGEANMTRRRAGEIVEELNDLGLIDRKGENAHTTDLGAEFIKHFKESAWSKLHEILADKRPEYQTVTLVLCGNKEGDGLTLPEICEKRGNRSLNVVTAEVCLEWGLRLGAFQKNLYTSGMNSRYYHVSRENEAFEVFWTELLEPYKRLNFEKSGHRIVFVSIPELREIVCERLRLRREVFDELLRELYLKNSDKIQLYGGPLTGTARKTPTSKLSIFADRSSLIMAPKIALEEQEGLRLNGRIYQMVALVR